MTFKSNGLKMFLSCNSDCTFLLNSMQHILYSLERRKLSLQHSVELFLTIKAILVSSFVVVSSLIVELSFAMNHKKSLWLKRITNIWPKDK